MDRKQRLLIIEDEAAIRTGLVDLFVFHGYEVSAAGDGESGLAQALSGGFDLVLLDIMLPRLDGFAVCERLREAHPDQPLIMLTAKTQDEDIVHGLRLGADDYVAKPFSVTQLVLRVEAVLRRARPQPATDRFTLASGTVADPANLQLQRGDDRVRLTRREMEVLQYLAEHPQRAVPREELLHKVWGYARDLDIETRTVDIHIAKIRRKLEPDPSRPADLLTIRGAGYRLMLEEAGCE